MTKQNNLDLELQQLDEKRQMRNLVNAIKFADSFSLLFVRCNQRSRQKELIEELKAQLTGYKIKIVFLENQIEHLLDELQERLGDEKPDAIFVYGLENSFPKADEAAESKFVVTLNHSRNSFKKVLSCPLVLFLPVYALSAIYHGATDFYSIRSGVYLFSAKAEETEQLITKHASLGFTELEGLLFEERQERIKTIEELLAEYQSLPDSQRNLEKEISLKEKLAYQYYISGEYNTASSIYQEIIKHARKLKDKIMLARSFSALGLVYIAQNKIAKAVDLYIKATEILKKNLGTKHPDYAINLNNMAMAYQSQGEYDKAIKLYKEAIDLAKETIGIKHPDYATRLSNLASVYSSQGKYNEAIKLYEESLDIVKETVGSQHLGYVYRLSNLARVYYEQEKYKKALTMFEEVHQICIKLLGVHHLHTKVIKQEIEMCQAMIKRKANLLIPYIK